MVIDHATFCSPLDAKCVNEFYNVQHDSCQTVKTIARTTVMVSYDINFFFFCFVALLVTMNFFANLFLSLTVKSFNIYQHFITG